MFQLQGGSPPVFNPQLPVFRPGGGQGGHSRIMQFLAGNPLNRQQLARMENGRTPGGFGGAFSQLNPAVLMQLAQLMQQGGGQLQGGQPPVFHPGQGEGGQLPNHPVLNVPGGVARGLTGNMPPGHGGPLPPRLRRLAGMKPPFSYPVR